MTPVTTGTQIKVNKYKLKLHKGSHSELLRESALNSYTFGVMSLELYKKVCRMAKFIMSDGIKLSRLHLLKYKEK